MGSIADLRRSLVGCRMLALDTMVFSYHDDYLGEG